MAEELNLVTRLNKNNVPVTTTQQLVYVLVQVQPNEVLAKTRLRVNFGFVLDHSGSMRGNKIDRLKEAVELAIGKLAPEDQVSVTVFNDSAQVIAPHGAAASQRSLLEQIRKLRAGGGTQMARGLSLGLREVYQHFAPDQANQVLLLTDGQTYGDEAQCVKLAKEAGEHKIPIQALGLGDDWNEQLLDQIAQLSGGDSDLVESADEIIPLFTQTVERSQKSVVRNAQMILRLVSGVVPRQVWQVTPAIANLGYTPVSEHDVQVQLGDLDAQEGKALLIELLVPPRGPGRYRIGQAEVRFDLPAQRTSGTSSRSDILLSYTGDALEAQQYDAEIMNLIEKVTAYKLQTRALDEAKLGNVAGATQKLRAAATRLLELGETELAAAASQEADNLEKTGQMSSSGTKKLHYQTRKLTQKLTESDPS